MKPLFLLNSPNAKRRSLLRATSFGYIRLAGAIATTALFGASSGLADEFWVGGTSTDWNTASNWTNWPAGQWTVINAGSPHTATITANSSFTPSDIGVGRGLGLTGRLDHISGTAQSGSGNWMWAGMDGATGTFNLANTGGVGGALTGFATGSGTMNARGSFIVGATGGTGVINVNTSGALNISGDLRIADYNANGKGTLNLDAGTVSIGGQIQLAKVSGGIGALNVSGGSIRSNEMRVGFNGGLGTVNLTGGSITTNSWNTFGGGGTTGNLNVSGGTFTANNAALIIGDNGTSTLTQTGGNVVVNGELMVGQGSGNGTVNFSSGTLTTNNWVPIGRDGGTAVFNMSGGTWNHNAGGAHIVLGASGGKGTVNLSGGLVNLPTAALEVGEWGNSTFTLSNTAELRAGMIRVGLNGTAAGTLNLNGGTLRTYRISGLTRAGAVGAGNSTVNFNGTQLVVSANETSFLTALDTAQIQSGGLKIDTNGFTVGSNQALGGTGGIVKSGMGTASLIGAHTYSGPNVIQAGRLNLPNHATGTGDIQVSAGASLGINEVVYNSQISPANLNFAGNSALDISFTDLDNPIQTNAPLNITGNLTLDGNLSINVADVKSEIGTLPLVAYASKSGTGSPLLGLLPENVTATLQDNGSLISLNITSNAPLAWDGDTNQWNLSATSWFDEESSTDDATYTNNRWVNFDDFATGTTDVVLDGVTVSPAGTLFENSTLPFTLSGTGSIGGTGRLVKRGVAPTTIGTANTYTGLTRIESGTLTVSALANGGSPSSIGQSSSAPENLAFAGGTLHYTGAPVTIDRGFVTTSALGGIGTDNSLTLTGPATSTTGSFSKSGTGNLILAHNGANVFGGSAMDGINVLGGTLTLDGSAGSQTNAVTGDIWVGTTSTAGANLVLSNTVLNSVNNFLAIARGNGTTGLTSTTTFVNSTITTGNLSLAYDNNLPGYNAKGILTLENSNYTLTGFNRIGESGGGTGTLVLNGASTMTSGPVSIGQNSGANGTLSIKGTSLYTTTNRVHVGSNGGSKGDLVIEGSGRMQVNSFMSIGFNGGGSVTVKDNGSFANTGDFSINESGDVPATVNLEGNGSITSAGTVYVGRNTGRVGTLTQTGGVFTGNGNEFQIGRDGQGSWLQNGGLTNAGGWVSLGRNSSGTGILTVSGTGTFIQTGADRGLMIGEDGTGTLNIQGTGSVTSAGTVGVLVSKAGNSIGTVNLDGGTLSSLMVRDGGGSSTFHFNGGVLKANTGAALNFLAGLDIVTVKAGGANIDSNGQTIAIGQNLLAGAGGGGLTKTGAGVLQLNGNNTYTGTTTVSAGSLGGTGSVAGPLNVTAAGKIAPGVAVGTFTVNGNATVSGSFACEVDGSTADKLAVDGTLNVSAATLNVTELNPASGPLIIASYTGAAPAAFASVTGLPAGYSVDYNYLGGNQIALVAPPATPYDDWATSFGLEPETNGAPEADADNDGHSNLVEYGFGGNPVNGSNNTRIHAITSSNELLMTVAVRSGMPAFSAGAPATASFEGFNYSIEGSTTLGTFTTGVTPVAPVTAGLPPAPAGYDYRTFRLNGSNGLAGRGFMRASVNK